MTRFPLTVAIVGPTAVGKSRLALALARQFDGEIVSADSRQVYRYMDIGTAKPSAEDRTVVTHSMIDLVAPDDTYSAQRYAMEGTRVLRRIAAQNRVAFVVGGTGFYVQALLDGVGIPPVAPDPALRGRLLAEVAEAGCAVLHGRLAALDPASAARVHPHNVPRVVRALEIIEKTGAPVPLRTRSTPVPMLCLGLHMHRTQLNEIIDQRVHAQFDSGLVEETRLLLDMGYASDLPSMQGFAYSQMAAHIAGEFSLVEAVEQYKTATRQYARRQMTWFRRDERIQWIDAGTDSSTVAVARVEDWLRCETART